MYSETQEDYSFSHSYLIPGEAVLWRGKPGKGHLFTQQDIFMIPFSILWCGFAIFWTVGASTAAGAFGLFGIPFVCVGLYITVGRFFHTAWLRRRTLYVITSKKIIRKRGSRVDMLDMKALPPMHITTWSDGNGTITFGQETYYRRQSFGYGAQSASFALENIPQAVRVHGIISDAEK